ncbi:hypothetical protein TCELL_0448 [Thermogladius calderae 1633]|uniref:FtsX-like permease family protein n=1 Tax=Thermogladius calderae (strain DSM 22663 / VKM B-2946 / 1633) TaxID=1184251 RepID=I3TDN5_THEC1|nr:hypothetical protein [Thermogladius calderae]AFK50873.1 hypothetical protein TCELL_0448 [Thermogladius calderae 1633]
MNVLLKLFFDKDYFASAAVLAVVVSFSMVAISIAGDIILAPLEVARGGSDLLVYNRYSFVVTGLLPSRLADYVVNSTGGKCVPVVLAPALINDAKPVVVRGVPPDKVQQVIGAGKVVGEPRVDGFNVMVGARVSSEVGVSPGELLLLRGVLNNKAVAVEVSGVFETGTLLDDEVLTSLDIARLLRGVGVGEYSVLTCSSLDEQATRLLEAVASNTSVGYGLKVSIPSWLVSLFESQRGGFKGVVSIKGFGDVVNLSRETSLLGIAGSLILSTAVLVETSSYYLKTKRKVLHTLLEVVLDTRRVRFMAAGSLIALFVSGYALGALLTWLLHGLLRFQVLFHSISLDLQPDNTLLYTLGLVIIQTFIVLRGVSKIGEEA